MVRLIALTATYYDGPIAAGTVFAVRDPKAAHLLKLLGRATDAPPLEPMVDGSDDPPKRRSARRRVLSDDTRA